MYLKIHSSLPYNYKIQLHVYTNEYEYNILYYVCYCRLKHFIIFLNHYKIIFLGLAPGYPAVLFKNDA